MTRSHAIDAVVITGPKSSDRYVIIDQSSPGQGKEIICRGIRFHDEAEAMARALNQLSRSKQ